MICIVSCIYRVREVIGIFVHVCGGVLSQEAAFE